MGPGVVNYIKNQKESAADLPSSLFDQAQQQWREKFTGIKQMKGKENPYKLHAELSETMMSNVLIVRDNRDLLQQLRKLMNTMNAGKMLNAWTRVTGPIQYQAL